MNSKRQKTKERNRSMGRASIVYSSGKRSGINKELIRNFKTKANAKKFAERERKKGNYVRRYDKSVHFGADIDYHFNRVGQARSKIYKGSAHHAYRGEKRRRRITRNKK